MAKILEEDLTSALVVVPSAAARVQDLGRFRSGQRLETDILSGSALVCMAYGDEPLVDDRGLVRFAFEGNANGAVNLCKFYEKCLAAAGRLSRQAPSIAYGIAPRAELMPVIGFDLLRNIFTRRIDEALLETWAGEKIDSFLPSSAIRTPTHDPEVVRELCTLPMRSIVQDHEGMFVWMLMDGTFLSKDVTRDTPVIAWRPGDAGLDAMLARAGIPISRRMILMGMSH